MCAGLRRRGDFSCGRSGRDSDVAFAASPLGHSWISGPRQAPRINRQLRLLPHGIAQCVSIDPRRPIFASKPSQKSSLWPSRVYPLHSTHIRLICISLINFRQNSPPPPQLLFSIQPFAVCGSGNLFFQGINRC